MKQALFYSAKVWLTTIVLASLLAGTIIYLTDTGHLVYKPTDPLIGVAYAIPVGLFVYLPSWFLFGVVSWLINKGVASHVIKKIYLTPLAFLLCLLPFLILESHALFNSGYWPSLFPWLASFTSVIAAVWFYKLPQMV